MLHEAPVSIWSCTSALLFRRTSHKLMWRRAYDCKFHNLVHDWRSGSHTFFAKCPSLPHLVHFLPTAGQADFSISWTVPQNLHSRVHTLLVLPEPFPFDFHGRVRFPTWGLFMRGRIFSLSLGSFRSLELYPVYISFFSCHIWCAYIS